MNKIAIAIGAAVLIGGGVVGQTIKGVRAVNTTQMRDNTPRFDTSSAKALDESTQRVMAPLYAKQRASLRVAIYEIAMHRIDPTLSLYDRLKDSYKKPGPKLTKTMMEVMHGRSYGELVDEANVLPREGTKKVSEQHHSVF